MTNSKIQFQGVTYAPSPYEAVDGQLHTAINVIPEEGTLRPILPPADLLLPLPDADPRLWIHANTGYQHYVYFSVATDGTLSLIWRDADATAFGTLISSVTSVIDVKPIGNILVISTPDDLLYYIYRPADAAYTYLGNSIPDIDIQFALNNHIISRPYTKTSVTVESASKYAEKMAYAYTDVGSITSVAIGYPTSHYFDSSVTLTAGTVYRISLSAYNKRCTLSLYGYRDGATEAELIAYSSALATGYIYFTPSYAYNNLYVISVGAILKTAVTLSSCTAATLDERIPTYSEDNVTAILGCINDFVANEATSKQRFIHPFFVRYAVKLYDGSYSSISTPILLVPNTGYAPLVLHDTSKSSSATLYLYSFVADLLYSIEQSFSSDWRDIIQSVCIFASAPIRPYDQSKEYDEANPAIAYATDNGTTDTITGTTSCHGRVLYSNTYLNARFTRDNDLYTYITTRGIIDSTFSSSNVGLVKLNPRDADEIYNLVTEVSEFNLIKEIPFSFIDTTGGFVTLPIADGTLSSLSAREALSENSLAGVRFAGANLYEFNGRLHLFGAAKRPPVIQQHHATYLYSDFNLVAYQVHLDTSDGEKTILRAFDPDTSLYEDPTWFFYPDSRAVSLDLYYRGITARNTSIPTTYCTNIPLIAHDFLSGAYAFLGFEPIVDPEAEAVVDNATEPDEVPTTSTDFTEPVLSNIYVSEVSNPFSFTAASVVTVGAASVRALAVATNALSQGQFGQYPLYAFTDQGVWALETASTGVYTARQPITRDVISADSAPCSLDNAVVFRSQRGLMLLAGSSSSCISDALTAPSTFDLGALPRFDDVRTIAAKLCLGQNVPSVGTISPFLTYSADAIFLYDYTHQRLIVSSPSHDYAYVYSLRSHEWGMMQLRALAAVGAYPDCLAVIRTDDVNTLADISNPVDTSVVALIVTRPFSLGQPDALKTVHDILLRGYLHAAPCALSLYASNNRSSWRIIQTSATSTMRLYTGTPYRAFRLLIAASLSADQTLQAFDLSYSLRFNNRLR